MEINQFEKEGRSVSMTQKRRRDYKQYSSMLANQQPASNATCRSVSVRELRHSPRSEWPGWRGRGPGAKADLEGGRGGLGTHPI